MICLNCGETSKIGVYIMKFKLIQNSWKVLISAKLKWSHFPLYFILFTETLETLPSPIPATRCLKENGKGGKSMVEMCCQNLQRLYPQPSAHISVILLFLMQMITSNSAMKGGSIWSASKEVTNNWPNVQSTWIIYSLGKKNIYGLWGIQEFTSLFQFFQKI